MDFNHNAEADFAASELARMFVANPALCYSGGTLPSGLSATAAYEPSTSPWPRADGLISLLESGSGDVQRDIALEYKRPQEGVHGLLTAIGQAQGYLCKGYHGAVIVVPAEYPSHATPADYVKGVLDTIGGPASIGVFHYEPPDTSSVTPFAGRLHCVRPLQVGATSAAKVRAIARPRTQWVHMREGSTTRDAFFKFLQVAKKLSADAAPQTPEIPKGLRDAVARLAPGREPSAYLANVADNKFLSQTWVAFWFEHIATPEVLTLWKKDAGVYKVPGTLTKIEKDDGTGRSQIFEGRADGLKETIVQQLNSGAISEDTAWEQFVAGIARAGKQKKQGIRERAHSYREDLDSSLSHLQWIEADGRPTDCGYRYTTICERYGGANSAAAVDYLRGTLVQTGRYASFLHYVHRLSERQFATNPLSFTKVKKDKPIFDEGSYSEYLRYLEDKLTDELKVMRKVTGRDRPRVRTPFQAELTLLRNYGLVSAKRYRLGVGIPIDWEQVVKALNVEL